MNNTTFTDETEPFDRIATLDELESTFQLPPERPPVPLAKPVDSAKQQLELYGITEAEIAKLRNKCVALDPTEKQGYDDTKRMLGLLRSTRTRIEKCRKEHNEEHHEVIRCVNAVAKSLTNFIVNLEDPLKEKKLAVDDAKERAKRAAEEAERERVAAEERAKLEAAEAERRAAYEAEQARLKAESDRIAVERQAMLEERRKLDAERMEVENARRKAQFDEECRLSKIREAEAAAKRDEEERQARELLAARAEALKPDMEKIVGWGERLQKAIRSAKTPTVATDEGTAIVARAVTDLAEIVEGLCTLNT